MRYYRENLVHVGDSWARWHRFSRSGNQAREVTYHHDGLAIGPRGLLILALEHCGEDPTSDGPEHHVAVVQQLAHHGLVVALGVVPVILQG